MSLSDIRFKSIIQEVSECTDRVLQVNCDTTFSSLLFYVLWRRPELTPKFEVDTELRPSSDEHGRAVDDATHAALRKRLT